MKKNIITGAIAALVVIIAIVVYIKIKLPSDGNNSFTPFASSTPVTYQSAAYGFSFLYPSDYQFSEQTSTSEDMITLTRKEDLPLPQASEAPPTITVGIYSNPSSTDLGTWLTNNGSASNYTLPNTAASATTVASTTPAIAYLWEGLYQGASIAFEHGTNVIIFTGTYNGPDDQILKDFETAVASIKVN